MIPLAKATSWTSRGILRRSTSRPFTSAIHTSGLLPIKLGSAHFGSNTPVLRVFSMTRALAWTVLSECDAQICRCHVWRKRTVAEKIDPSQNVEDPARPSSRLSRSERARALPAQRPGHCARQVPIFRVKLPVANIVGRADDPLVDGQHSFWDRVRPHSAPLP